MNTGKQFAFALLLFFIEWLLISVCKTIGVPIFNNIMTEIPQIPPTIAAYIILCFPLAVAHLALALIVGKHSKVNVQWITGGILIFYILIGFVVYFVSPPSRYFGMKWAIAELYIVASIFYFPMAILLSAVQYYRRRRRAQEPPKAEKGNINN